MSLCLLVTYLPSPTCSSCEVEVSAQSLPDPGTPSQLTHSEIALSHSEDWHYRHAALMAISAVGEGCEKQMTPILGDVVTAVLPFCQDRVGDRGLCTDG